MKQIMTFLILLTLMNCNQNSHENRSEDIEQNLRKQFDEYLNSMLTVDIDKIVDFMNPMAIERLKAKFPKENDIPSIKRKLKETFKDAGVEKTNKKYNMQFKFGNILDSVHFKDEFIYILNYTKEGLTEQDTINIKSSVIAVSKEKGTKWEFMELELSSLEKYKELFKKYYPTEIVEKVFKNISNEEDQKESESDTLPTDEKERRLYIQFNAFFQAMLNGDNKTAFAYLNPCVFEYLQKKNSSEFSLEEIKQIYKRELLDSLSIKYPGDIYNVHINKVLNKITTKYDLLYLLSYSVITKKEDANYSFGGEAIAVSKDKGNNWVFFENNKEISFPILSINYSEATISKLLNY